MSSGLINRVIEPPLELTEESADNTGIIELFAVAELELELLLLVLPIEVSAAIPANVCFKGVIMGAADIPIDDEGSAGIVKVKLAFAIVEGRMSVEMLLRRGRLKLGPCRRREGESLVQSLS